MRRLFRKIRIWIVNRLVRSYNYQVFSKVEIQEAFSQLNQARAYILSSGHLANHYKARQHLMDYLNLSMGSIISAEGRAGVKVDKRDILVAHQFYRMVSRRGLKRAMRKKHLRDMLEAA